MPEYHPAIFNGERSCGNFLIQMKPDLMTRVNNKQGLECVKRQQRQQRLRRLAGQAISDYGMIEGGDRVMVCLSGGKDSYALLDMLILLRKSAPITFDLIAVNLDQKQPGFPEDVLLNYMSEKDVPF